CSSTLKSSLAIALLATAVGRADANSAPWSEHALPAPVDIADFQGTLQKSQLQDLISAGDVLFNARFASPDGVGRPMATQAIIPTKRKRSPRSEFSRTAGLDANACSSCHNVPKIGGAGDFSANVFVSEGFQHSDFDTTDPQFSNERNTNHLFGAGLIELLAREMSADLIALRQQALAKARHNQSEVKQELESKGIKFGHLIAFADGLVDTRPVEGVDHDLIIRPFSHKGVMTSLRQFSINALNHHHGMQADERFGLRWTGEDDFDEDTITTEISEGDVSALVAWQASLPPPTLLKPPTDEWVNAAAAGLQHFTSIGCADCHVPFLPLNSLVFDDPGPLDAAGTLRQGEGIDSAYDLALLEWAASLTRDSQGRIQVPLFGDLKRHTIADQQVAQLGNELLSQRFVERNVFITTELWGVASTAPYGHRGNLTTLREIINAHGGDARASRDAWKALQEQEQNELIAWLKTLVIEP
ncbi:MAG: di-heme oxidoredictase family protein, partial [Granulosicoccus sp.]